MKKTCFFRFFILKYLFYKFLLILRENEQYFQTVDMPREKDLSKLSQILQTLNNLKTEFTVSSKRKEKASSLAFSTES